MRTLAGVPAALCSLLLFLPEIAKQGSCEHVCSFGNTGDTRLIDKGGWLLNSIQFLKRMRPVDVSAFPIRIPIEGAFRGPFSKPPRWTVTLLLNGCEGHIARHVHGRCDGSQAESFAHEWCYDLVPVDGDHTSRHCKLVEIYIR